MEMVALLKLVCVMLVGICVLPQCLLSLPTKTESNEMDAAATNEEPRATWLETRNIQDNFKELVYLSINELVREGLVNPNTLLSKPQEKRGRHQGFCFKKTKSGRFLPYICWKEGDNEE